MSSHKCIAKTKLHKQCQLRVKNGTYCHKHANIKTLEKCTKTFTPKEPKNIVEPILEKCVVELEPKNVIEPTPLGVLTHEKCVVEPKNVIEPTSLGVLTLEKCVEPEWESCPICLEPVNPQKDAKLNCKHPIHIKCAKILHDPTCPVCKAPIEEAQKLSSKDIKCIEKRKKADTLERNEELLHDMLNRENQYNIPNGLRGIMRIIGNGNEHPNGYLAINLAHDEHARNLVKRLFTLVYYRNLIQTNQFAEPIELVQCVIDNLEEMGDMADRATVDDIYRNRLTNDLLQIYPTYSRADLRSMVLILTPD